MSVALKLRSIGLFAVLGKNIHGACTKVISLQHLNYECIFLDNKKLTDVFKTIHILITIFLHSPSSRAISSKYPSGLPPRLTENHSSFFILILYFRIFLTIMFC
jgi:hypothetical protein